jgi:hypothetical protein
MDHYPEYANQQENRPPAHCAACGQAVAAVPPRNQTVLWVIALLLAVIATAMLTRGQAAISRTAVAQSADVTGRTEIAPRSIYAFSGQLTRDRFGLFMMDVDAATVWCYELAPREDSQLHMRLVAARSWYWDRSLEEFNVAGPVPGAVREMVLQQRSHRDLTQPQPSPDEGGPVIPGVENPPEDR